MTQPPAPPQGQDGLFRALEDRHAAMTPSERAIAAWLRDNIGVLPFNTGVQIATAIGVSEMTLIRFLRSLGYGNLRDLKKHLQPPPGADTTALDDVTQRFTSRSVDFGTLTKSLELELDAMRRAYEITSSPVWERIVTRLAETPLVHVLGFQAVQGVAMDFASRLKYVRPGIRFARGSAGVYSEVLESDPATSLIFLVDTEAYAREGVLLARKAKQIGIPMVIMTDRFSHWAREFSDEVLEMNTLVGTFWDSTASLAVATNLLIHFTAGRLGEAANARFDEMVALGEHFDAFDMAASRLGNIGRWKTRLSQSDKE
ncbi:MurR/RpiR family transcriptional regulator [Tabrizicola oligotrophica]|uniref:MurR/RpiR family transcriptional regulator n=1 Tax=Tabrizicola oligotrophica TaxID=2710650 RepID=A0A6M0QX61_9RHOB|nr:MurR/RpiR family transcriptional regulator [Tabrizicola oligotrophica]NEY92086.1 MurR/RpiR family transcriptional regulator [Tabrizicola oligotrophica]